MAGKVAGVTAAAFPLSRARLGKVSTWLEHSITMNMTMFVSKHYERLYYLADLAGNWL